MNKLLVIIASIFLIGCVTRTEFVVGTDGQGNEILKEKSDIDYVKAANDRINLAIRYIEMKQMTDAKINLEKAEQYNPGTENLYLAWGYYYSTVGDSLKAEKVYKIALDEYDSGSVNTNYGIFLCNEKRFKEANEHFMKAVAIPNYPRISFTYERAATCAFESGDNAKAGEYFEQAMNYGGNSPSLLYNYAYYSFGNGDVARADKLMRTFDMFEKNSSAQALMLKIRISTALGQYSSAEIYGRKLLQEYANSEEAKQYKSGNY
jgi:type IV pilus assembly protein PilF